MDAIENDKTRADPDSTVMRMNLSGSAVPYKGKVETMKEVLASAKRTGSPGQVFEYGSPITLILPNLCEAVTKRRWSELFEERVWSKMGVEGDMLMGVTPDGLALAHGLAITRLRDLVRYGMLYTPSWNKAAHERIVSEKYLAELMKGGDPEAYKKGGGAEKYTKQFGEAPSSNHYQWDAIFADGDFYKAGLQGQGLYVSPSRDVVVVYFSTIPRYNMPGYARNREIPRRKMKVRGGFVALVLSVLAVSAPTSPAQSEPGKPSAPNASPPAAASPLIGTSSKLVKIAYGDDSVHVPDDPTKYTLIFLNDTRIAARIDCNRGNGAWKSPEPGRIEFGPMATTRAMCPPGSLHDRVLRDLPWVRSYVLKDGKLFLSLMADGGIYEYEPHQPAE